MQVWIDQDCCTGAGLCVDRCPDLFIMHEDGIGYVYDDGGVVSEAGEARPVPARYETAAVDAAEACPGECIYLEADPSSPSTDDADIDDTDIDDTDIDDTDIDGTDIDDAESDPAGPRRVGVMATPSRTREANEGESTRG